MAGLKGTTLAGNKARTGNCQVKDKAVFMVRTEADQGMAGYGQNSAKEVPAGRSGNNWAYFQGACPGMVRARNKWNAGQGWAG